MKPFCSACFRRLGGLVLALAALCAWAQDRPNPPPWTLTQDGAYAIHLSDKLAWRRCVEGMHWDGKTCVGTPVLASFAQAMALAAERRKADGVEWRLPSVTELQRLVNKNANPPGLDTKLFPAAPGEWQWAGTANVRATAVNPYNYGNIAQGRSTDSANQMTVLMGWAVHPLSGEARAVNKRSRLLVRLVAPQD